MILLARKSEKLQGKNISVCSGTFSFTRVQILCLFLNCSNVSCVKLIWPELPRISPSHCLSWLLLSVCCCMSHSSEGASWTAWGWAVRKRAQPDSKGKLSHPKTINCCQNGDFYHSDSLLSGSFQNKTCLDNLSMVDLAFGPIGVVKHLFEL